MKLTIVNPWPFHNHLLIGTTEDATGHRHSFSGVTGPAIELPKCSELGHVHEIYITHCSFLCMHSHIIKGITGPPLWVSEREHYHRITGFTLPCLANGHCHDFSGVTKSVYSAGCD
ncbi:MAG: YmaF family protein [Bacillota bacterium]